MRQNLPRKLIVSLKGGRSSCQILTEFPKKEAKIENRKGQKEKQKASTLF